MKRRTENVRKGTEAAQRRLEEAQEAHQRRLEKHQEVLQKRLEESSNIEYPPVNYEEVERFFRDEDMWIYYVIQTTITTQTTPLGSGLPHGVSDCKDMCISFAKLWWKIYTKNTKRTKRHDYSQN